MFEWINRQGLFLIYLFLFLNAMFESVFPPYPSDAFVLVFSFLAGRGYYDPYLVYSLTVVGSIVGIMLIYHMGMKYGDGLLLFISRGFLRRIFPVRLVDRARKKFRERGDLILLLNRFIPGMRAPIGFVAGMSGIKRSKFFIYSAISVIVWNAFLITVGFYVGASWDEASLFLRNYSVIAALILVMGLIVLALIYYKKHSRYRKGL
ncbi:MAG: DedA family protein [candidate division WOR-3 bacterium]|nr:DedA family protein [candidate division WOR-3 bacterium]